MAQIPDGDDSQRDGEPLRAAFRDLHGARLHGFALLVSLGDRRRAASAAADVLTQGARRAGELRHPERAAAWLRARVLRRLRRGRPMRSGEERERRAALDDLGVVEVVFDGLAVLSPAERAALVASAVERFGPIDIETILGLPAAASHRLVARARERYLAAVSAAVPLKAIGTSSDGALAGRIRQAAGRAVGTLPAGSR